MFQRVNMKARSSQDYMGSVYSDDASGMLQLEDLRVMVRNLNRDLRKFGAKDKHGRPIQFRVEVRGREPVKKMRVNTNHYYLQPRFAEVSYNVFGNIVGGISNASRLDVYLYRRSS